MAKERALKAHLERAAINTPIQGSAADIAASAMVRIAVDPELKRLGFTLLLQVKEGGRGGIAALQWPFVCGRTFRPIICCCSCGAACSLNYACSAFLHV